VLIATSGNINLNNTNATDLSVFASGSINANGSAKIGGTSLFATGTTNGSVTFNSSTKTVTGTDQLQVIAQGNITYNGSSDTRGSFLSAGTFTYNGSSTLYGSIGAKCDITFNGKTTVIWASIRPFNQAPTDLGLSPTSIAENVLVNSVVGTLSTTDPNPGNTFTYSLVSGTGSTDNAAFTISGNQLKINSSPDFEAKSSYSIRVRTTDQDGLSYEKTLTVSITDVNETPTSLVLSNSITSENVASGSAIGSFTSTDPDANNTFTYSLVTGTGSTDNAAFSVVGNQLKINASPDFEAKSSYSIRVRTTDQGGLSYEKALTISVTDVNEIPTSLVLSNSITPENVAAGSLIGTFATSDPDTNNTFTYSLVSGTGATDNASFSVVGNQLKINASPNFEAKSSYSILVRTTDQGGLSYDKALVINVSDVNEAPISLVLSNNVTPENVAADSVIGTFTSTDPDANNTFTYSLVTGVGSNDNAAFSVVGNQLKINASPDFEAKSSYSILVRTTDQGGLSFDKVLTVSVTDLNEVPTSLVLGNNTTPENVAAGSVIGTLTSTDPDLNNTFSYSLVSGTGSTDNATFSVVDNKLQINTSPDFESKFSYSIRVRTTDRGGLSYEKALTVSVVNVNEAPTAISLTNASVVENSVGGTAIGQLSTVDPDFSDTHQYVLLDSAGDRFELIGNTLHVKNGAVLNFESNPQFNIEVKSTDAGGLSTTQRFTIAVSDVNEAPTLSAIADRTIPEGSLLSFSATATDPDRPNQSLVYSLDSTPVPGVNLDPATGLFTWTPTETQGPGTYAFTIKVSDGSLTDTKSFNVQVAEVNSAPILGAIGDRQLQLGKTLTVQATATDPDLPVNGLTYSLDSGAPNGASIDPVTGVLSWTPTAAGDFQVTVRVTDNGTPQLADFETIRVRVTQPGGSGEQILLKEQSDFAPERTLSVTIPTQPSILSFKVNPLTFDLTDTKSINDAFEVTLVDAQGKSLLPTLGTGRDSFFNWTEGFNAIGSAGTTYDATTGTVRVNLTGIAPGTAAQLVFRLVNDDADTTTQVRITDLSLTDAPSGTVAPVVTGTGGTSGSGGLVPVEFNHLQDVTPSVVAQYQRTSFNDKTNLLYADVALQNNGTYAIDTPLIVAVNHISDPSVQLRDPDGFTPEGLPFHNFSSLVADGKLDRGEASNVRSLVFYNPNEVQFTYDLVVLAGINQAPVIQSQPSLTVVAGKAYQYDVEATDLNQDTLGYTLVSAPQGMSIDSQTGKINWLPTSNDRGTHSVAVKVSDGRGGIAEQIFSLDVEVDPVNRPPTILSVPVVDANIDTLYRYQVKAEDLDRDTLSFRLVDAPQGMSIDPVTGVIQWTPSINALGKVNVVLKVEDGKGGESVQSFSISTQQKQGNLAPIITSNPIAYSSIGKSYTYDVNAVDPDGDLLIYSLVSAPVGATIDRNSGLIRWTPTTSGSQNIRVQATDIYGGQDFQDITVDVASTPTLGEIHGNIWEDINGNGLLDGAEKSLPNTKVYLDLNNNQVLDFTEPTQFTTALGDYNFTGLSAGQYIVREVVPEGFIQTFPSAQALLGDTLIQNGSFESGPSTGYWMPVFQGSTQIPYWNIQLSSVDYCSTGLWQASDGRISIDLDGTPGPGGVSQTIATIPGQVYVVTFDLSAHGFLASGTTRKMTVSAAGQSAEFTGVATGSTRDMGYQSKQWQFTATSTSTQIAFNSYVGDSYGAVLDNVSVRPVINPSDRAQVVNLAAGQVVENINFGDRRTVVNEANSAPTFVDNLVPDVAQVDKVWKYQSRATDLDLDTLAYDLLLGPTGMVVDSTTGLVVWRPTAEQLSQTNTVYLNNGVYNVLLRAQDGKGGVDLQSFKVNLRPDNAAPIFTSTPDNTKPQIGKAFQYQAKAQDSNGDTLTYALQSGAPSGVSINASTGLISWTPTAAQLGSQSFTIQVTDGKGGEDLQKVTLTVGQATADHAPVFTSTPRTTTRLGNTYLYDVAASDSDGDVLTYTLRSAPTGMTLKDGVISWVPTATQSGDHTIAIQVSDGTLSSTQTFTLTVANQAPNHAPTITSAPTLVTNLDRPYVYNLSGSDSDNDLVVWSLENAPDGMVLDAQTGSLRWQPKANQLGNHTVIVKLADSYGAFTTQEFTLKVTGTNTPPTIASTPITKGAANQAYAYQVAATDPENDALRFSLGKRPQGMAIDTTGKISWTPQGAQVGTHTVEVQVTDSQGATTTQTYNLEVGTTPINHTPEITSTPRLLADINTGYRYQIQATDPDRDPLTYQLLSGPQGMTIDPLTGLTQWQNPIAGTYQVVVGALDNGGLGAAQSFTLTAKANGLPTIQSTPSITATPGVEYKYDLQAKDPEGDTLTYALDPASQALGMTLDNLGRLRWTPTAAQLGTQSVTLTVTDSAGAKVTQQFNLTVTADTEAPNVNLIRSVNIADPGDEVFFQVQASDNIGIKNLQLSINNTPVSIDGNGVARLTNVQPGTLTAKAIATDLAGNQTETTTTIQVLDPTDTGAPQIDLDLSGITNGTITGPVAIKGSVTDTNLSYYVLEVAPLDSSAPFKEVFRGTANVSNGTLGTFDPSLLLNDSYILRLSAFDTNGQGTTTEQTLSVAGELKLGNFRLSFTDLTIPVTGIPITLTRTYDSLTSNTTDDFGYGWRMEFRDTDLRTSLGKDEQYETFGIRSKGFKEGTRVYITLPGGKREAFTFKPTINRLSGYLGYAGSQGGVSGFDTNLYNPAFTADAGVTSTLSVRNPESSGNMLSRNLDTGVFRNIGGQLYNPGDSYFGGIYVLTTKEGIEYEIDGQTGDLLKVTDTDGNTLTYTDADITSSTGQKVTFERDAQNRITSVIDPMGNKVTYDYDAKGDLVAVSDREGNTTKFEYDAAQAHYLDKIVDPLGRTGIKNEYDASGKLKKILDANGNAVEMVYDPNNSIQKVKDALGNETVYEYDNQGNVVTEVDAEGKITKSTYDANNNVLKETIISDRSGPNGFTTEYTYDSNSNRLSMIDTQGNTTYYTYDSRGHQLSQTDSLGRTTLYTYDKKGHLTSSTDALGVQTKFNFTGYGELYSVTDANGQNTSFTYDNRGNVSSVTDSLGHVTQYTYNANGDKLTETRIMTTPTGVKTLLTQWSYDSNGHMISMIDAENHTTRYEYNDLGQQIANIDTLGRKTIYRYDNQGKQIEVIYPDATPDDLSDNLRTQTRYDILGRMIATIDRAGHETRYVYDKVGRLTETLLPDTTPNNWNDNPRTQTEYYDDGLVKAQIDERNNRTEYRYDALGRQIEVIAADNTPNDLSDNPRTRYQYDAVGEQTAVTNALGQTTTYTYDTSGRLILTRYADQSTTATEYDKLGRRTASIDQNGKRTAYRYDALGQLIEVEDALNDKTTYSYNEVGKLVSIIDAENHTTQYEYDSVGRRIATVLPLGQRSTTSYDAVGNTKTIIDFNGKTTAFAYDSLNRLTAKQFQDGSAWTFTYTANGQQDIVTLLNSNQQVVDRYDYNYNERDWLIQRTDTLKGSTAKTIGYSYDLAGNRTAVTTASGTTNYTFDSRNRLDKVIQNGITLADYDYNAVNNLTATTFSNGTQETRQYDLLNRLTYLENHKGSTILSSYAYTLDKVGNRTQITEQDGRVSSYVYDDLYRLAQEKITDPTNGNRVTDYSYDKVGNRQAKTETINGTTSTTRYSYDGNDRLLSETTNGQTTTTYIYDNNGNTLSKQDVNGSTLYNWNDEGRLIQATTQDANGNTLHQMGYRYNANGIRVSSTTDGEQTLFLIDNSQAYAQVLEEYKLDGSVQVAYVYGNDLINQTRDGQTAFYLVDGLGSTRVLTDAQGNILNAYDYEAFGKTIGQTGTAQNQYLFAGEHFDIGLGDYYLRDRYYDSDTGRFTRRDTYSGSFANPLTLHKYIFGNDNPVNNIDPTGFFATSISEISLVLARLSELAAMTTTTFVQTVAAARVGLFAAGLLTAGVAITLTVDAALLNAQWEEQNKRIAAAASAVAASCGIPLFHYTSPSRQLDIISSGQIISSPSFVDYTNFAHPPGVYATTIPPVGPFTQQDLRNLYKWGDTSWDVSRFVMMCQNVDPFWPTGYPMEWVRSAPPGVGVPVTIVFSGINLMPPS
jgi:choice-of-anchor C domain-containing protein